MRKQKITKRPRSKPTKKLTLNKETLRLLSEGEQLEQVVGGKFSDVCTTPPCPV